jgi:chromosomal replication initiator protein
MELTAEEAWSRVLERARAKLPEQSYRTWLSPTKAIALSENVLVVAAPSDFAAEWIEDKYGELLADIARSLFGEPFGVAFEARPPETRRPPSLPILPASELEEVEPSGTPAPEGLRAQPAIGALQPNYTLETFVIGGNSQLAAAACHAVAATPGRVYNPLFIYGGVGLGKTHLMQGIAHSVLAHFPRRRVAYIPTEQFTNDLIEAIRARRMAEFRHRYRRVDVLLVDDVHFLAGKEGTQEEFFHTFNTLYDAQKQIVLTSDRAPKEIAGLQERLVSRFEWGLVVDIRPPDFETRLAILEAKAAQESLSIPRDVLALIAERCRSSVRELEGALLKLLAYSSLARRDIDRRLAEEILRGAGGGLRHVTAERIEAAVADAFGVAPRELRSKARQQRIVAARQAAMYLERELLKLPYAQIGARFAGRDHSTVIHAVRKLEERLQDDPDLRAHVEAIRRRLT